MERSNKLKNVKVGIVALLAFGLAVLSYWYVGALSLDSKTYLLSVIFRDAQGVDPGTAVMMAGVKIGQVETVSLTDANRALIDVRIKDGVRIPPDSAVRLASSSLLADKYVEFLPGPPSKESIKPNKILHGMNSYTLDDLMPQVSSLLDRMEKVGESAQGLLEDSALRGKLASTMNTLNIAAQGAANLVQDLRGITASNRAPLLAMTTNLASAMENLNSASAQIRDLMSGTGKNDMQEIMANLKGASKQIELASTQATSAATNVAAITGDPALKADLLSSVQNVKEATESAKSIVDKIADVVGVNKGKNRSGTQAPSPPKPPAGTGAKLDFLYDAKHGKSRFDANYTLQMKTNAFYQAGLYDIGERTKINLQGGKVLGGKSAIRGGLYQSRLGLGYDWQAAEGMVVQGDLYRPNDPRLDLRALKMINQDLGAWIGVDDIGGGKEGNRPMLGIQYKY